MLRTVLTTLTGWPVFPVVGAVSAVIVRAGRYGDTAPMIWYVAGADVLAGIVSAVVTVDTDVERLPPGSAGTARLPIGTAPVSVPSVDRRNCTVELVTVGAGPMLRT